MSKLDPPDSIKPIEGFTCETCNPPRVFSNLASLKGHCTKAKHKLPDKYKEEEKRTVLVRPTGVHEDRPFESIYFEGRPAFLLGPPPNCGPSALKTAGRQPFEIAYSLKRNDDTIVKPLSLEESRDFPYRPYSLSRSRLETFNEVDFDIGYQTLADEVFAEYKRFVDAKHLEIDAVQTLESYRQHQAMTTSYLAYIGLPDSGKSRRCEIHSHLDFRPLYSTAMTAANVYGFLGYHEEASGTIIDDEIQDTKESDADKLTVYRMGYRRGAVVARTIDAGKKSRVQRFYEVFCCKVFAGHWLPFDEALKSRCIILKMKRGNPEQDEILQEDLERFDRVKMDILVWRLLNYFKPQLKVILPKAIRGRSKELWKPKIQVTLGLSYEGVIRALALEDIQQRRETAQNSQDAMIAAAVQYCFLTEEDDSKAKVKEDDKQHFIDSDGNVWYPFKRIWDNLMTHYDVDYAEAVKATVDTPDGERIKKARVGFILSDAFGGKKSTQKVNKRPAKCYLFKAEDLLDILKSFYLVPESVTDVTDVTIRECIYPLIHPVTDKKDSLPSEGADRLEQKSSVNPVNPSGYQEHSKTVYTGRLVTAVTPVTGANQPISHYEGKNLHVVIDGNEEDEVGD